MILEAKRKVAGKELEAEPSKAKTKHEKFINEQIFKEKFINEIKNDAFFSYSITFLKRIT